VTEARLESLAEACRDGDESSARALVEALTRPLMAMAWRYVRDWDEASDLAQETWIKAFSRLDAYETGRPFRAWLFAIHRNGCLDHLRGGRARYETLPGEATIHRLAGASRDDPATRLERRELRELLLRATDVLSPRQRSVFLRVDVEGGEPKRVAAELGIEHGTLRATLHAARRRVAEAVTPRTKEQAS
jgi:RNA polymerase sigma-70 factor, ECF subfamily